MGCLESCLKKNEEEADERTSLLGNGNSTIANTAPINTQVIAEEHTPIGSVSRSQQDEQTLLNGILTKYSSDVIDVTAIDSRIDAVEYMNRVTLYNRKLTALGGRLEVRKPSLRSACNNPATLLGGPMPSFDDIMLINEISESLAVAAGDIRVIRKQDLTIDLAQR
ncbi:ragulator complex protein LAMTOR1-like [Styela clava]|uniref:ragulator complex protein LAMTOR1-like n=1 Tax=Styela clava TaxID=7725 RepID=UPI0019395943|nr:ragulator complex protein LAMTOR1-like [Styela clava]